MDNQPQHLTRHERRELNRHEKGERRVGARKKQLLKRISLWGGGMMLIVGLAYLLVSSAQEKEKNRPGVAYPIQGRDHIAVGATHDPYNSDPPTSGPHYAQPAEWGVYDKELPDEQLIHSLEHGGIWISYKDIDQVTKDKLTALGHRYPGSVIITPRAKNDAKIVLASWGRLEKFDQYNEDIIEAFIKANKNDSPEPLAK